MALTSSNMLPLGSRFPHFSLFDTTSQSTFDSESITIKNSLVVMFICNHCPFVIHLHKGIQNLYHDYKNKGVTFIAISSNDVENYPQDNPTFMQSLFSSLSLDIPYLYDESQNVAKQFEAACTPDFYVFDNELKLQYRGQFDSSRPNNDVEVTGEDIRKALDAIAEGEKVFDKQVPSIGCNIKWKS